MIIRKTQAPWVPFSRVETYGSGVKIIMKSDAYKRYAEGDFKPPLESAVGFFAEVPGASITPGDFRGVSRSCLSRKTGFHL
jgi:hypothetical protein